MRPINVLRTEDADDILVICVGVPQQDYDFLKAKGIAAVYGPGNDIPKATEAASRRPYPARTIPTKFSYRIRASRLKPGMLRAVSAAKGARLPGPRVFSSEAA